MFTITPYFHDGMWVFDDPAVGLEKEGLTDGVPEIIEEVVRRRSIRDHLHGFTCTFSRHDFPGADIRLDLMGPWRDGHFYLCHNLWRFCWFCPALTKYFPVAPQHLFLRFDDRASDTGSPRVSGTRSGGSIPLALTL